MEKILNIQPDHLGYAVKDIRKSINIFLSIGYEQVSDILHDDGRDVFIVFLRMGSLRVELLSPANDLSPVKGYLAKVGNTPYHICYGTQDIDAAIDRLKKLRFRVIEKPGPSEAFNGRRVAFLYHVDYGLLELVAK